MKINIMVTILLLTVILPKIHSATNIENEKKKILKMIEQASNSAYNDIKNINSATSITGSTQDFNLPSTDISKCCEGLNFLVCSKQKPGCFSANLQEEFNCTNQIQEICFDSPDAQKTFANINKSSTTSNKEKKKATTVTLQNILSACIKKNKNKFTNECYQIAQKRSETLNQAISKMSSQIKSTNRARQKAVPTATAAP